MILKGNVALEQNRTRKNAKGVPDASAAKVIARRKKRPAGKHDNQPRQFVKHQVYCFNDKQPLPVSTLSQPAKIPNTQQCYDTSYLEFARKI